MGTGWRWQVPAQYRMATTELMHPVIAPEVRIEQTRIRLAKLRDEGLVDRVTLPQAGRTRVWATQYGVHLACEWPELRDWRPPRLIADRTAARLRVGHALTVGETGHVFLQDARRRVDVCRPLDWIPEVHHPLGNGKRLQRVADLRAVIMEPPDLPVSQLPGAFSRGGSRPPDDDRADLGTLSQAANPRPSLTAPRLGLPIKVGDGVDGGQATRLRELLALLDAHVQHGPSDGGSFVVPPLRSCHGDLVVTTADVVAELLSLAAELKVGGLAADPLPTPLP
ncbi:replication-relaxation family protein [Streptomyces sp. NPDC086549]|uniref:replication-relaxation family protein n=1 Tax=Streptomyces sp. NPDC086549 TaxID=3365752 RepID=UPI00382FE618